MFLLMEWFCMSDSSLQKKIEDGLIRAIKGSDKQRVSTLRLIKAALKDREIALRGRTDLDGALGEGEILSILDTMVRQREEAIVEYRKGEREDLARREQEEIAIITAFMPEKLAEDEIIAACRQVIEELGAAGIKDMGRVMNTLKKRYPGQMNFTQASGFVRDMLLKAA